MEPKLGLTLLEMANELWKMSVLTSSSVHTDGSPADVVQEIVAGPPLVRLVGVVILKALTRGRRTARALRYAKVNIACDHDQAFENANLSLENIMTGRESD